LTLVEIGHIRIGSAGNARINSRGSGSSPSQRTYSVGGRISGMRSCISATKTLASVVMIAKLLIHSPEVGSFQFSHRPPMPKGPLSCMAMA
jgi:hypothetical protein